tara:strand:- start:369 stop:533 length:165 start_codon:yes stop_codon:yes gene_type:complete
MRHKIKMDVIDDIMLYINNITENITNDINSNVENFKYEWDKFHEEIKKIDIYRN